MLGNILSTLGKSLIGNGGGILSSILGGMGGNSGGSNMGGSSSGSGLGGILSSLMGSGGNSGGMGSSTSGSSGMGGFGDIAKMFMPMMNPTIGNMAGSALGTYFGGPAGGAIGGDLGSSLSGFMNNMFGGKSSNQQQGQQEQQYGPQQSYGNQTGTYLGNNINQGFNKYMPSQIQNQTFGNMGGALGDYFGSKFGMGDLGKSFGNIINPYIQKYMPENMRDVQMGNLGGYLGNQFGQRIDDGFQRNGLNPYSTPNYGNQLPDYSQSYGNSPQAPEIGDLYNRAPGGYVSQEPRIPIQEPSSERNALLGDIRNYRREPSYPQKGYGNVPQAPSLGDLYGKAPGNSSGYGIRSGVSQSPNSDMFSEFKNRASQPGMGLKPTQTRSQGSYPQSGGDSMMDLLRNRLGDIRNSVSPDEFSRNYTVRGV